MVPLQTLPGGPELVILALSLLTSLVVAVGFVGGVGYFYLRVRSGGSVAERLGRIERKVGRLEAQVEALEDGEE
jgi:uncharacterized membrane protein YciS (DUF1049 family)